MIRRTLTVDREHTRDYDIVTKEVSIRTIKFLGIIIFRNTITVINNNVNITTKKPAGFKTTETLTDEESNRTIKQ